MNDDALLNVGELHARRTTRDEPPYRRYVLVAMAIEEYVNEKIREALADHIREYHAKESDRDG